MLVCGAIILVALDEQFHRDGAKPRSRCRKDGFGRYGKSPTASVNSVACIHPNGGLLGNIPNGTTDYIWQGWQVMEERSPFCGWVRQFFWQYVK